MNRTYHNLHNLANVALKSAPLVTLVACFVLGSGNLVAGPNCYGGSMIKNSAGKWVGCSYSTWGTANNEQSYCGGMVIFGGNANNCHVCVAPPYDTQVANNDFSGLTLTPITIPGQNPAPPTTFSCLKCTQPPSGLTGWWALDETDTTVKDQTGNLPNGFRFGGVTAVLGEVGNAAHFNGLNQYIQIPDDPQLNVGKGAADGSGDFSLDAWVKIDPKTDSSGVRVIFEKRVSSPYYKGYSFYLYNRYLGLQLAEGATGYSNYGGSNLVVKDDGQWHFVAVSVKRQPGAFDVQFTLDPTSVPAVHVNAPARTGDLTNSSPARIGMVTIGSASVFNGTIDELEFFNRYVTVDEWSSIQSAGCYGKCGDRPMALPIPPPPASTCQWDSARKIWDNCTN